MFFIIIFLKTDEYVLYKLTLALTKLHWASFQGYYFWDHPKLNLSCKFLE